MIRGDVVEVIASHWNCSVTSKFLGQTGVLQSVNVFGFCDVDIKGKKETFHEDELTAKRKKAKK